MKYKVEPLSVGERIRLVMGSATTTEFAGQLGLLPSAVESYLRGCLPDPMTLVRMSETCNVTVEWLLRGQLKDSGDKASATSKDGSEKSGSRRIPPPVNLILNHPNLAETKSSVSNALLVQLIRIEIPRWVSSASDHGDDPSGEIAASVARRARALFLPRRSYVNATGIIIHTGWGNSQFSSVAKERVADACGASPTGAAETLSRVETCATLLRALTGAEAATVTTMNAANLLLVAGALAAGRDLVVAARDLVEISNGARIADILQAAGARLVPVGSANCVYIEDYQRALSPSTGVILKSRVSNMASSGYVAHVDSSALAALAHRSNIPYVDNLGGGSLVDLTENGLPDCPTLQQSIRDNADLVLASGDKIIGGPQAGIIVGKKELVDRVSRHPLARTCRPAKLTLAALEATLGIYVSGRAWEEIPSLRMLNTPLEQLFTRASTIGNIVGSRGMEVSVARDTTECGGAVLPGVLLPTWTVQMKHPKLTEDQLYAVLMARGVVARRAQGLVIVDLRSVSPQDDATLVEAIASQGALNSSENVLHLDATPA